MLTEFQKTFDACDYSFDHNQTLEIQVEKIWLKQPLHRDGKAGKGIRFFFISGTLTDFPSPEKVNPY